MGPQRAPKTARETHGAGMLVWRGAQLRAHGNTLSRQT